MKYRISLISKRLIYSLFLFSIIFFAGTVAHGQEQRIVLQNIHLQEGERVYGIELSINAGSFIGFAPLPMGWYLIIDNADFYQRGRESRGCCIGVRQPSQT